MPIVPGSRYTDSPTVQVRVRPRTRTVITPSPQQPQVVTFWWHQLSESDTLALLAAKNYGDPNAWWKIADANPEVLDWHLVPPGTLIRIPAAS